ncbi:hypothetical protein N7478_010057 [Penicillium angulare]|uniref:uncharacterized protein n=1 Tax=Penicillium angulare TaxID=116970 RepID=UPI00254033C7|nr:uncharacterized protein N7478_010057 [Penicillium angulare]KAJ5267249.1 hypothetical protein N7478_010057 [Penicillium angulare]
MIVRTANQICHRSGESEVGKNWVYGFTTRVKKDYNLNIVTEVPIEKKRLTAEDIGEISLWFDYLEPYIEKIPYQNIYNFDEIGFQSGQIGKENVPSGVTPKKHTRKGTPERAPTTTIIECVSADGSVIPPYIIFACKGRLLEDYFPSKIPGDWAFDTSPNGFITQEIALEWLRHFQDYTFKAANGYPRLLLFDGHDSHLTLEFLNLCDVFYIIPFVLSPIQPISLSH